MRNPTMMNTPNLEKIINTYFGLKTRDGEPFTIPGLALACGFSKSGDILGTLKEAEDGESPYPEPSVQALTRAVTRVEEHCLVNGLKGKFPAALAKFCLGAYHNVKDTNENANQTVTQLAIVFSEDPTKQIPAPVRPLLINQNPNINPLYLPSVFDREIDNMVAAL